MDPSAAAAITTSVTMPGDDGTLPWLARVTPYQTSEPANQSVVAEAQSSIGARRFSGARAYAHHTTKGTGQKMRPKIALDVWRGDPAIVAPRYARSRISAVTAST